MKSLRNYKTISGEIYDTIYYVSFFGWLLTTINDRLNQFQN